MLKPRFPVSSHAHGLVAAYLFSEGGALWTFDRSGGGRNAQIFPGAGENWNFDEDVSYDMNGDSRVHLGEQDVDWLDFSVTEEMTIEMWLRTGTIASGTEERLCALQLNAASRAGMTLARDTDKVAVMGRDSGGGFIHEESAASISSDTVYHFVATIKEGEGRIYVNGHLDGENTSIDASNSFDYASANTADFVLGVFHNTNTASFTSNFNGRFISTCLFDRVLSEGEVLQRYIDPWTEFRPAEPDFAWAAASAGGSGLLTLKKKALMA